METDPGAAVRRSFMLFAAALAAVVGLTWMVSTLLSPPAGDRGAGDQMVAVSPGGHVELHELEPELRQLYQDVAADPVPFEHVRCYCGCEAMLDHRHLRDCFERPDGGWERHAVGCAVCQLEARDVLAGRAAGQSIDEITAEIDKTYAGITEET